MGESAIRTVTAEESAPGKSTVLVVDDEETVHDVISRFLKSHRIISAYNGWEAREALEQHHIDVVLLDLNLPDMPGMSILEQIQADGGDVEVIVVTAHSELGYAVEAVKKGAFDFLAKTYESYQQIDEHIMRALQNRRRKRQQIEAASQRAWVQDAFDLLEQSQSGQVRDLVRLSRQVAATPLTMLIAGEPGTGKEILARYVHAHSNRAREPFVAINVTAVPDTLLESHLFGHVKGAFTGAERNHVGKFEQADGGTLFLDEISELDASAQVKLLRVLQEREVERLGACEASPVNVRVIAATNKVIEEEVRAGRFREDLFYRLNVVRLPMPPLRQRREDMGALVELLAAKHAASMRRETLRFSRDAMVALLDYDWPGNIRELENLIMQLVAVNPGKTIVTDDIPTEYCLPSLNKLSEQVAQQSLRGDGKVAKEDRLYFLARDQFERYLVRLMVRRCGGDRKRAARELGVSLSTIKEKLRDRGEPELPDSP